MFIGFVDRKIKKIKENTKYKKELRRAIKALKLRNATIGQGFLCNGHLYVYGVGTINIGDNVTINSSIDANPVSGSSYSSISMEGGTLTIGNGVGISNTSITCYSSINIEDMVAIGAGCMIADSDFHSLDVEERHMSCDPGVKSAPITIQYGAFIGARSIILKGVNIGRESVVAAGSVITKSIPDKEVWGGNPARFIRKL